MWYAASVFPMKSPAVDIATACAWIHWSYAGDSMPYPPAPGSAAMHFEWGARIAAVRRSSLCFAHISPRASGLSDCHSHRNSARCLSFASSPSEASFIARDNWSSSSEVYEAWPALCGSPPWDLRRARVTCR